MHSHNMTHRSQHSVINLVQLCAAERTHLLTDHFICIGFETIKVDAFICKSGETAESSGVWYHVVWYKATSISDEQTVSILRVQPGRCKQYVPPKCW
jgi:hypothetical protein